VLVNEGGYTRIAFADGLKQDVCDFCGITIQELEARKEEFRAVMQLYGERRRNECLDYWINRWFGKVFPQVYPKPTGPIVVPDVRYMNEAAVLRDTVVNGTIIRMFRTDQSGPAYDHPSETELDTIQADHYFRCSSPEEAIKAARDFLAMIRREDKD
jgi:hypothetical protein